MELSQRVEALTPSSTLAITAKAAALRKQGFDVISLGAGEPDFNTPEHIIEAAAKAARKGYTKYTPAGGMPELKEAIVQKFAEDQGLTYRAEEVFVGAGAKHVLYNLFQTLLNEGDEVLVIAPYWVSYPEQIKLAGGKPIIVETDEKNDLKVKIEDLQKAAGPQTKALVLNSPSNPTGVVYDEEELREIGRFCLENEILIISDEIYEKLVYDRTKHISIATLSNALKKQTFVVNGVSKSHAMTGWRIGYCAGNARVISAMSSLASHSTSNAASISQHAALAAYRGTGEAVEKMRQAFEQRLETVYEKLIKIPGFTCVKPQGAFYLFPNVKEAVAASPYKSVMDWCSALLEKEKVAVVPGAGFGAPDHIRLSYATALEAIEEAIKRIERFVFELSKTRNPEGEGKK